MGKVNYRKKILIIVLLALMPFSIAGCWGRRETQQMNLSTALGFDYLAVDGKPQFRLTILSAKPPQGGGGMGSSSDITDPQKSHTNHVISINGDTIWDAGRNLDLRSSRKLFIGQVVVVVIGEETARHGLGQIMDFLLRHQEIRERTWIVICKGMASDFLNSQPEYEPSLSAEIDGILKNARTNIANVKGTDLFNVSYALLTPGKETVIPYMTIFTPREPSSPIIQNQAGSTPNPSSGTQGGSEAETENQPQRKTFEAIGFALFRGDKMQGLMNEEESQGLLFLNDQVKTGAITIAVDDSTKNVSIRIDNSKTKIEPIFTDSGIEFKVVIKASGILVEESDALVKIAPENWQKVENLVNQEIEKRCLEAVKKSQDLYSDVMGFGDKIHRTNPGVWEEIEYNWEQIYPTVTVTVEAEFKLKQTGVISDPIEVR
jgi:spore germination protein KC